MNSTNYQLDYSIQVNNSVIERGKLLTKGNISILSRILFFFNTYLSKQVSGKTTTNKKLTRKWQTNKLPNFCLNIHNHQN
ncbi:hypothetical protein AHMF7616_00690 [Adhaeribacter pallidiroseus]|uniref:Uncharacterized protein n=1 Tax=Adhaeribacter pallidiroseus TaxID=2072847 RepID=A0A369QGS9_9BACT|nr:hypothetical protein AHMF7616_00690 [Adhaeribacter pallidiroseus]